MKKRVVILTGAELRHTFFRKWIASCPDIEVIHSYCEGTEKSLGTLVHAQSQNELRLMHLQARVQSEEDFFRLFVESAEDLSHPIFLPKGEINSLGNLEAIREAAPDILVCYGSSIIREPLLSAFPRRFLNIHLGLSPYYRGSGTNYWPLVNGEPQYVGGTFMHIDAGVDTGEVIHQIRARVSSGDTPVQIGNRLIVDMATTCRDVITHWHELPSVPQIARSASDRIYRKKDYTEQSVAQLYQQFREGLVDRYLRDETKLTASVPILSNPVLTSAPR